ncbi:MULTISPECIES: DUF1616 domain-containing protein [Salinibaculum]|uniref:DUF1616 domain-containing protein n=1 Tax=Salinibaculum TaxID=2732368 RepID=UPI0030D37062
MAISTVRQSEDLVAVMLAAVILCGAVVVTPVNHSLLLTVLALPLALFFPGYALIAALFPEEGKGPPTDDPGREGTGREFILDLNSGIDMIERMVFSFVMSILMTSFLGILLDTTPFSLRRESIAVTLTVVIVVTAGVGMVRRTSIPPENRFNIRKHLVQQGQRMTTASRSTFVINGLIIACLIITASGAIYAAQKADEGETFTELYLLSEDGSGNLINEVPQEFTSGKNETVHIGIENHEQREVTYTVSIQLQRIDHQSNQIVRSAKLDRYQVTLGEGEESVKKRQIQPPLEGENMRLVVFLYRGTQMREPTTENAYRDVYAWVNVIEGEST